MAVRIENLKRGERPVLIEVLSNVRCRVTARRKLLEKLDAQLSYPIKGAWHTGRMKPGGWDGRKHLLYLKDSESTSGTFPKGLLSRVVDLLDDLGRRYRVKDYRKKVLPAARTKRLKADMLEGVSMDEIGRASCRERV